MRQKFWSKHICGSQNWVCIKTIRRACKNTDAWPLHRVSDIVGLGRTWEHIFLPSFQACKWRCSKGHTFRTITWDFPLTFYPFTSALPPPSFSLHCAKDIFLQPLVPWFSLQHKTFVIFLLSLTNKINSLGYQTVWRPDFTSCYPMTYDDSPLEVLSSH